MLCSSLLPPPTPFGVLDCLLPPRLAALTKAAVIEVLMVVAATLGWPSVRAAARGLPSVKSEISPKERLTGTPCSLPSLPPSLSSSLYSCPCIRRQPRRHRRWGGIIVTTTRYTIQAICSHYNQTINVLSRMNVRQTIWITCWRF